MAPVAPQLPVEIKPTVTISRQFEGRLIYKSLFLNLASGLLVIQSPPTTNL